MTRVRLDTDERREQLLRVGVEMIGTHPADALSIGAVARAAGVSKGLLYHYFRDKEQFFVAVAEAAAAELNAATEPDKSLPPLLRVERAIDGLITFAEEHAAGYIALFRGELRITGVAEVIQKWRARRLTSFVEQFAQMSAADPDVVRGSRVLKIVLDGQLSFLEMAVVHWLEHREISRAELHRLLIDAFLMAMIAAQTSDPALRLDSIIGREEILGKGSAS